MLLAWANVVKVLSEPVVRPLVGASFRSVGKIAPRFARTEVTFVPGITPWKSFTTFPFLEHSLELNDRTDGAAADRNIEIAHFVTRRDEPEGGTSTELNGNESKLTNPSSKARKTKPVKKGGKRSLAGESHKLPPDKIIEVNKVLNELQYCTPTPSKAICVARQDHPLRGRDISTGTWLVLRELRRRGYAVYLAGGSVRDLYLSHIPKDFDVLSSATIKQIKGTFKSSARVIGRRFPICHVYTSGEIIEVSSFETNARPVKKDGAGRRSEAWKQERWEAEVSETKERLANLGWRSWEAEGWENAVKRDLTVNGLLYDPFRKIIYDYVGGIEDLNNKKIRTITPPLQSFTFDAARMLRAIRVAARLGFNLDKETGEAIEKLGPTCGELSKSRLVMELAIMMERGAAEASVRLLWRHGLLHLLLPLQAAFFESVRFRKRSKKSNLLLDLLKNLDSFASPDKPCPTSAWITVLAFHLAIQRGKLKPEVIACAALAFDIRSLPLAAEQALRIHKWAAAPEKKGAKVLEAGQVVTQAEQLLRETVETVEEMQQLASVRDYIYTRRLILDVLSGREVEEADTCYILSRTLLNTVYPKSQEEELEQETSEPG